MLPSQAITAGIALSSPLLDDVFGQVGGVNAADAVGAMLIGYASTWHDAYTKVQPIIDSAQGLYDPTVLIAALNLKGAAKNKVQQLTAPWQQQRPCPECGAPHWTMSMMIHLNDQHEWDRSQVSVWLAGEGM